MRQLIFLLAFLCAHQVLRAQDPSFSQLFASPTSVNPALTGLFPGRYRIALGHRSQWGQVLETPFSTSVFSTDFHYKVQPKRRDSDSFGGGVTFINDRVAGVGYSANQVLLAAAYHKSLDARARKQLSFGAQYGIQQRSLGYGELTFQDQFNGIDGFQGDLGAELLPENSRSFGDVQLGINYSILPQRKSIGLFAGAAIHHVTQPELSFYADRAPTVVDTIEVTNTLYRRYSAYATLRIPLNINTEFSPRIYLLRQGEHALVNLGGSLRLLTDDASGTAIHLGAYLRLVQGIEGAAVESATGLFGLEVSSFLFGLSYDAGLGSQGVSARHRGVIELSVTYTGMSEDDEAVPCPKF